MKKEIERTNGTAPHEWRVSITRPVSGNGRPFAVTVKPAELDALNERAKFDPERAVLQWLGLAVPGTVLGAISVHQHWFLVFLAAMAVVLGDGAVVVIRSVSAREMKNTNEIVDLTAKKSVEQTSWDCSSDGPVVAPIGMVLERVSNHHILDYYPETLVGAVKRVVGPYPVSDGDKRDRHTQLCYRMADLLDDDLYADDVVTMLYAVAATDNKNTLEEARRTVDRLHEVQEAARRKAVERAEKERLELTSVQPDYSDDFKRLVERHRLVEGLPVLETIEEEPLAEVQLDDAPDATQPEAGLVEDAATGDTNFTPREWWKDVHDYNTGDGTGVS